MLRILTPWDSQPQEPAELANWLPAGTLAYIGGQKRLIGANYASVGTINQSATTGGLAESSGTTASYINAGAVQQALVGASWVAVFRALDSTDRWIAGTVDTSNNYFEDFAVNVTSTMGGASAGRLGFGIRNDGTATSRVANTTNVCLTVGAVHVAVIRLTSSSSFEIWVDGVNQPITYGSTGTIGTTSGTTDFPLALLNRNLRGAFSKGTNVDLLMYLRTPAYIENVAEVSANPWSLLAPRFIWVPVSVGGGGSVSGTSATTNANDTPSANGTTTVVGTSATTNAADTSTASGDVGGGASGTSATTNANDTSSASGTTTVTGTVAYGNANDAVSASGWAGLISGTVAVTNADDTSAAVGSAGPVQAARLFAGGFPRREQFRKGYIIKGKRYWLTEDELSVMVAQMLAEVSRGDIKQVTAGKPKPISKKTWDAIQVEARIDAVAKQFDDTDEDEDESILMML